MTSRNSISADNNNMKFFLGTLKGAWTQGVISFSVMFFLGPVLLLMLCNSYDATIYRPEKNITGLVSTIYSSYTFYCVFAAILAVLFAIAVFNYLNSRVSVNFYHSLPFKRTRMFFTNYFSGITMFAVGFLANYLICIAIPAVTNMGFAECLPAITSVFVNVLIYFILIYSMTVLVGMTTGLAPVQWLMTVAAFAILPAIKLCVNALKAFEYGRYWIDYFLEYEKFLPTTPVVILYENTAFSPKTKLVFILISVLCTVLAVTLYHYRLSEKSGNPFVFNKFASVVKYIIMFPASMAFALIFGYMGDENFFWLLFGSVSGAVVAWMIMNSIINKTARAMFTAVRGMIIFTVSVTLFNAFLVYGTYPLENMMLNDTLVRSVTLELDGNGRMSRVTFDEDETKSALLDIIEMEVSERGSDNGYAYIVPQDIKYYDTQLDDEWSGNVTVNGKEYYVGYQQSDYIRVNAVAKTWFGYEIACQFSVSDRVHDYFKELEIIANSDEYKEEMLKILGMIKERGKVNIELKPNLIKDGEIQITTGNDTIVGFNDYTRISYDEDIHGGLFDAYEADIKNSSFDMYNAPVIGQIYVRDTLFSSYQQLPITTEFTNTLEYLKDCGIINSTDYAYDLSQAIRQVHIYDYKTGEVLTVTDDDAKLKEIFESVDTYDIYSQYSSFFNTVDHRYKVFYDYRYLEMYGKEEYRIVDTDGVIVEETSAEYVTYSSEGSGTARAEFI
ncbi:MAG: hypothetical protein IJ391_05245, partial [Clostridia bacterium]|nr:hypothetical protein [Clostridia bacterium]